MWIVRESMWIDSASMQRAGVRVQPADAHIAAAADSVQPAATPCQLSAFSFHFADAACRASAFAFRPPMNGFTRSVPVRRAGDSVTAATSPSERRRLHSVQQRLHALDQLSDFVRERLRVSDQRSRAAGSDGVRAVSGMLDASPLSA